MSLVLPSLSPEANRALAKLEEKLPQREWLAVSAWLTTFYPYQLEWLLDFSRYSLVNKSRQVGASHAYAAATVLWGMVGETTTVISIGEREALEFLDKVRRHAQALTRLGSTWSKSNATTSEVKFVNGGRVIALPSSGGRGYSGNVILDELAYYQNPEKVWDGASAVIMHQFKLRCISTPNGVGNFWHNLYTNPKAHEGYRLHAVTIDEAIAQGLKVDEVECWRMARGDPRVFDQLFRCKFVDNEQQYLPTVAIEACSADDTYCYAGECYAGLDLGRSADRTELVIVKVDAQGIRWLQHSEGCKRTSQDDVERLAALAFSPQFRAKRLCVDATGMGTFPTEQLQKRFGRTKVEPITFTAPIKEDLATGLYSAFVEERIRIPKADTLLRDDLCSIRRIVTSAGNVRYDAPHTDAGHADRAWALALALHACSGPDRRRYEIP